MWHTITDQKNISTTAPVDDHEVATSHDVLGWFSLDLHERACPETPDELACLSLTTDDDAAESPIVDGSECRWM